MPRLRRDHLGIHGDGPRPIPEGETAAPQAAEAPAGPAVEDNVSLEPTTQEPVKVEEGVKLEP